MCPWCGYAIINGQLVESASIAALVPTVDYEATIRKLRDAELRRAAALGLLARQAEPDDVLATDYLLAIIEDCGREPRKAIPLLRAALRDRNWSVRLAAANALARIGPAAKEALPALRQLLQDNDQLVRDAAEEAIKSIDK